MKAEKEMCMGSCMVEKFKYYIDLNDDDIDLLLTLEESKEHYRAGQTINKRDNDVKEIFIISEGWSVISTKLDQNVRSVFDVKLNGDFVGMGEVSFPKHLYDLVALTDVVVCPFPKDHLDAIFKYLPTKSELIRWI